jgi:uncharacterized phage-like protein YoqJ
MVQIAITGHRPDAFLVSHYTPETVMRIAEDVAVRLKREHGHNLCFNLGGAIGVDQWMGMACIEHGIRFRLYLPFHPSVQAKFWSDEQKKELDRQMQHAAGIDLLEPNPEAPYRVSLYQERNKKMVDDANFTIAFWVGKKRGGTMNAMKYSLKESKFVLNAMDNLRPLFKEDLEKGWTPPTVKGFKDE